MQGRVGGGGLLWGESLADSGLGVVRSDQVNAGGSGAMAAGLQRFSCYLGLSLGLNPDLGPLLICFLLSWSSLFYFFVVCGLLGVNKSQPSLVRVR